MTSAQPRKLTADTVCAYIWALESERERAALCSLASVTDPCAILEWYELEPEDRAALRIEIGSLIAASAERQRKEWAERCEKMKRLGMLKGGSRDCAQR